MRATLLVLATSVAGATTARAQATPPDPIAEPTRDVFDLVRQLRHKPPADEPVGEADYKKLMVAVAPVIGYNPATGFSIGGAGNIAFFSGAPATTRISSVVTSLTVTTKSQMNLNAKFNVLTPGNGWNLVSDDRLYLTNQDTYGLGTSTTPADGVNVKYDYLRLHETSYRQVRPNVFAGASFLYGAYRHVEANPENAAGTAEAPYIPYSNQNGFGLASQTSAGAGINALFDNRDSSINPSRGVLAALDYKMFFKGFLDGTSNWQAVHYDLRTYVRLSRDARRKLAFWLFGDLVTGGAAPYFDLPTTGGDTYGRSGRGYTQGRFRGQRMIYGEAEYRWTLTTNGLLGMVTFLNAETLSNEQTGEKLFDSVAMAGGAGLRLMLSKRSKTNLCLDLGLGEQGSKGVYFGVQEAF